MQTTTQAVRLAALAATTGVGGPLNSVKAKLLKAAFSPSDASTLAELADKFADFDGADEKTVAWSSPAIGTTRQPFQESQLLLWIAATAPAIQQQIFGVAYINPAGGGSLLGVDMFSAPILVKQALDSVQWICTVP